MKDTRGNGVWKARQIKFLPDIGYHPATGVSVPTFSVLRISATRGGSGGVLPVMSLADADAAGTSGGPLFISNNGPSGSPEGPSRTIAEDTLQTNNPIATCNALRIVGPVDLTGAVVGDPVYLSATDGEWTLTAPAVSGDIVRQIGQVTNVDTVTAGFFLFDGLGNFLEHNWTVVP